MSRGEGEAARMGQRCNIWIGQNGRGRATQGLRIRLPANNPNKSARSIAMPHRLVFGRINKTNAISIQISP